MKQLLPWILACAALIVIGARTRDGWVVALAIATLLAACIVAGIVPSL